ncbi:hypothetical protein H6761_03270 [Candidatus Nomurabacteria bacterium]|nr:hypothetical protein [Candidatus Nomurabacteria bacterium]
MSQQQVRRVSGYDVTLGEDEKIIALSDGARLVKLHQEVRSNGRLRYPPKEPGQVAELVSPEKSTVCVKVSWPNGFCAWMKFKDLDLPLMPVEA